MLYKSSSGHTCGCKACPKYGNQLVCATRHRRYVPVATALYGMEQQMVEACVCRWKPVLVGAVFRDDEVEVAEALDGHAVATGAKEEEALLLLERKLVNDLRRGGGEAESMGRWGVV
eukprot:3646851-Pleurochrysis_carterae.AAC.1